MSPAEALVLLLVARPAPAADPPLDGAAFAREVLAVHPDLRAAASALEATRAEARGAGARPEPMASVSVAPLAFLPDAHRVGVEVMLEQRLPLSGGLALERAAARAAVDAGEAELALVRLDLALAAFELAEDRWLVDRAILHLDEQLALVEEIARGTRAALAAGGAGEADALAAERMLEALRAERAVRTAERTAIEARMNALLRRAPDAALPPAGAAPPEVPPENPAAPPELRRAGGALAEAEALARAARRAWVPDLALMTSYSTMWDAPEHRWMVGLATDLPLGLRARSAAVDAAAARVTALAFRRDAAEDAVAAAIHGARAEAEALRAAATAHDERLLPLAGERLRAARAAFAAGSTTYVTLAEAVHDWIDAVHAADEAASAARRAEARLLRALGVGPGGSP